MKQSETVKLGEAIASLWDEDPDMYEQLLVHRMMGYLPEVLGNLYRWVVETRFDEGVLRLRELREQINRQLHAELVRVIQVYV